MSFVPQFEPPVETPENAWRFLFHEQRLLVRREANALGIPTPADVEGLGLVPLRRQFLGSLDGMACYGADVSGRQGALPEPFDFMGMANQLGHWHRNHQYCGACGYPTEDKTDERAKRCSRCGAVYYPRLSPPSLWRSSPAAQNQHRAALDRLVRGRRRPTKELKIVNRRGE